MKHFLSEIKIQVFSMVKFMLTYKQTSLCIIIFFLKETTDFIDIYAGILTFNIHPFHFVVIRWILNVKN